MAAELADRGAEVTLITSSALAPPAVARVTYVETAAEMADAVLGAAAGADVVVMAAAVADYRPAEAAWTILTRRPRFSPWTWSRRWTSWPNSVLGAALAKCSWVSRARRRAAAELAERGRAKLAAKGADLIVANEVGTGRILVSVRT